MTDFSHITDETLKEWGGLSASLTSAPSKRDLTVSEGQSKIVIEHSAHRETENVTGYRLVSRSKH